MTENQVENSENPLSALLFVNPLPLPLEKLYLKIKKNKGKDDQVKAIDKFWVSERYYPCYAPLPDKDTSEEREIWLKRAKNYITHLSFVLDLPYFKFWSYILYEPAIPVMLDSFLRNAVSCYLPQPTGAYEESYSEIYDLVFRIYTKIFTPKVSETEFVTPKSIGKLLKEENVITNFTLWDICKLYGHTDDGTVGNMLNYAYENIPDLKEELILVVTCMTEIFEAIGTAAYEEEAPTEKLVTKLTKLLYDTAFAINMFMKVYPPFKDICIKEDLFSRIIHTYDSEVPLLFCLMKSVLIQIDDPNYNRVDNARVEMLETCHSLMSYCMDMILQKTGDDIEQNKWIDTYLKFIDQVIAQHTFLTDFDKVFPISQDVEMLQAICPNIDQEKCNSILSTVVKHQVEESELEAQENSSALVLENGFDGLDEATVPEDILIESKITELMDMFPDLGDGFLEQCLLNMDMDSQQVIIAILEDNLPPHIAQLDRSLPRIPPEVSEPGPPIEAAYVGKKPSEHKDLTEMLNDKTHVKEQKERFLLNYSLTKEEEQMYDDDYDDQFEGDYNVVLDYTSIEEIRRPKMRGYREESEEEEEEDEEQSEEAKARNKNNFCEDPALIRARREARYQQMRRGGRGGGGGGGGGSGGGSGGGGAAGGGESGPPPNKNKDVVGKPKGQGQDKKVVQNRDKKNTHKSSRANHNRRQGASFKRSRGMIPS